MTTTRNPKTESASSTRAIKVTLGALAAMLAVIVVIALLVGGSDDTADTSAAESAHIPVDGELRQVSFAEGVGDALPRHDSTLAVDPAVGQPAPKITASYFDNTEVTIDLADGTPRLVMFFAHWCPHCQDEVRSIVERFGPNGLAGGVELLAISTSVQEGQPNYPPSRWFLREDWAYPVLRDSETNDLAAAFGLTSFPFAVAVDGQGNIVARSSGQMSYNQFDRLVAGAAGADLG